MNDANAFFLVKHGVLSLKYIEMTCLQRARAVTSTGSRGNYHWVSQAFGGSGAFFTAKR